MTLFLRVLGFSCLALALASCGGGNKSGVPKGAPGELSSFSGEWPAPNQDLANRRVATTKIDSGNVDQLGVAWTIPIQGGGTFGNYASTPIVADGVVYTQDLTSNVKAIDLKTGQVKWAKNYNSVDEGPNGVALGYGKIYGATSDFAFALDKDTGKEVWRSQRLTRNANEGIDMPPGYNDGTVYVSTVPGNTKTFYAGNGQAILTAMDASTGAIKWKWDEVPANLWSEKNKNINSGGGQWQAPTFDGKGNMYVGVANPAPFTGTPKLPWGSSRPGPNLYTNSIVKLNASTGKLIWYYQLTPHDIYDWDMQNSPMLATVNGKQVVIDGGKAGIVVAVDAQTGKPLWKRPVGIHNGHDNDNLAAQKGDFSNLKIPETVEPGDLGGIETQLATNGKTVFAAVNNLATVYKGQGLKFASFAVPPAKGTGNFVAVDVATGKVKWDNKLKFSPYGAATIANDVVFTTTFDGTLHGYAVDTGKEIWSTKLSAGTNAPVASGNAGRSSSNIPSSTGIQSAFLNIGGVLTDFVVTDATATLAYSLNANNQSCGYYIDSSGVTTHGFWRDRDGTIYAPIDPVGSTSTILFGNTVLRHNKHRRHDLNLMVGRYTDAAGATHGILFSPAHGFVVYDFPGATFTSLNGINERGVVVGRYTDPSTGIDHGILARVSWSGRAGVMLPLALPSAPAQASPERAVVTEPAY